ncbi:phage tail spike protein [Planococcus sp. SSTMD024]|uniref:phage tail spike protein n=1 Tax=Planococcus sp. SSTMD024 TaxID=3242163 RepID=UPI00351F69AD
MEKPKKILFFHQNTGRYLGTLDNRGNRRFWGDEHVQDAEDGTNYFNFFMPNNIPLAEKVVGRVRVLIPHEDIGWQEFIVHSSEDDGPNREVRTNGAEIDLNKLKIIEPDADESLTAFQYLQLITTGTIFEPGIVEFQGSRSIDRSRPRGGYDYLGMVGTAFNLEIRIRTQTKGGRITRRFVDLLERVGDDRSLTVEYGKDLVGFRKFVDSHAVVTSLYCQTPEREDGTRLFTTVTHAEAFQEWNWQGTHLTAVYEPESDDQEMTVEELREYGTKALNKLVASIFEYDVEAVSLEHLFPHKKVRLGDRINVKNKDVKPAIYARARVLRVIRSISNPASKRYIIGEIREQSEEEVRKVFRQLQNQYGAKIVKQPDPPPVRKNWLWVQTKSEEVSGINNLAVAEDEFEVPHVANSDLTAWVPTTATTAGQIGGLELGRNYNGVSTTEEDGLVVMRSDGLVRTISNATEGISIESRATTEAPFAKVLYLDTEGNIKFAGDLEGAGGSFSGALSSGDGASKITIDNGYVRGNDRTLFSVFSVLPEMHDKESLDFAFGKSYTHRLDIPVSTGNYSPGDFIEVTVPIVEPTTLGITKVLGVFVQSEAKEWYVYERKDSRAFTQGELSSLTIRISPHYAYASTGTIVPISIQVIGTR